MMRMPLGSLATWASSALAAAVFAFLDVVDVVLCFAYGFLDGVLEDSPVSCYCHRTATSKEDEEGISDTLYERRSVCRDALTWLVRRRRRSAGAPETALSPRWSDCGCASCGEWKSGGDCRLHVAVKEAEEEDAESEEDAVFIHGFTSSSSFWAETAVFRESSSFTECRRRRLLAVDLLGFGRSPKPGDCLYRLKDHVDAIERSLAALELKPSYHLVSHSMGCIIALALAARQPSRVKSITLVAPPYFSRCECECEQQSASQVALRRLAAKKLWPPLLFGSAVMSWYEHIGRTVCLVLCKHHAAWERLLRLLTRGRDLDFRLRDLTKHTHHSAWHTMHNVVCGGARMQDRHLDAVDAAGVPVRLVHGDEDQVVPVECSRHLKIKLPRAELRVLHGRDHSTVLLGRERDFAQELSAFWSSSSS